MDVPGGHAGDLEPPGQLVPAALARTVAGVEGPLELDAEAIAAEGAAKTPARGLVLDALAGASGEADQALGVRQDVVQRHVRGGRRRPRMLLVRVSVRACDEAAEVG